jgi:hypothetical protein
MNELPRLDELGPDPEPLGVRGEMLLELERVANTYPRFPRSHAPRSCPLAEAAAKPDACIEARCPYFRVPGTKSVCAVEQWSPAARRNPRIARWFMARRDEITRGRGRIG